MSAARVELYVVVEVEVDDSSTAVTRATENIDNFHDLFQPPITDGLGVVKYLAEVCARLGVEDASRLDGWADLKPGDATMRVTYAEVDTVRLEGVGS